MVARYEIVLDNPRIHRTHDQHFSAAFV